MTPQKQEQKNPMFHYFQMEDLVPQDHILRQIDKLVDFSFVRDTVKDCYCPDNGRPGVDPELVVRIILIGYLYNLSENRLCQEVTMHAEKRLFCHMTSFVPHRLSSEPQKISILHEKKKGCFRGPITRICSFLYTPFTFLCMG